MAMRGQTVIPRARVRAPLWRRLLALARYVSRRMKPRCATCDRLAPADQFTPYVRGLFHDAHTRVDWYRDRIAKMPTPGDGVPRA